MRKIDFAIIGANAAGMSAAGRARRRDPKMNIQVFERDDEISYAHCGMPFFISRIVEQLDSLKVKAKDEFEKKRDIRVHLRHEVVKIDPSKKTLSIRDLDENSTYTVAYDKLLIAAGATPFVPPGIDLDLPGVFVMRDLHDAAQVHGAAGGKKGGRAVVLGGGPYGLEMVEALVLRGFEVTVVEMKPRLLSSVEPEISEIIENYVIEKGARVLTDTKIESIQSGPDGGVKVHMEGDRSLRADILMVVSGQRPNSGLAERADLEIGEKGAIKVDRYVRTSDPDIYAAGDCAETFHRLYAKNTYRPLGLTANRQGRVVGDNVTGKESEFPGILGTAVLKVFDVASAMTGLNSNEAKALGYDFEKTLVVSGSKPGYYPGAEEVTSIVITDRKTGKPIGAQMAGLDGVPHRIDTWAAAIASGMTLSEVYELDLGYTPPYGPPWSPVLVASRAALKNMEK